jgi:hypothetical protein
MTLDCFADADFAGRIKGKEAEIFIHLLVLVLVFSSYLEEHLLCGEAVL